MTVDTVDTMPAEPSRPEDIPMEPIWRLSVAQYHEMVRHGILTEDDQVELLEGWLIAKMSKNPPHRISKRLTSKRLNELVPAGWYVEEQEPITTTDSEPEPDIAVIRGDTLNYPDRHPGPGDTAMVVEIADASLGRDRTIKKRAYARAGVPIYWIINLIERTVEVYSQPTGPVERPTYGRRLDHPAGESVPFAIEGRTIGHIPVVDLLPPPAP
jgi:Uma2 family endonuclease